MIEAKNTASSSIAYSQIPIVLGVVGHRDLYDEDQATLTAAVQDFLRQFHYAHPNTPLILLTGLAEGADCLVAEAALKLMEDARIDIQLGGILPFSDKEFLKDFSTPETKNKFSELLSKVAWKKEVTPKKVSNPADPDGRNRCYAEVGHFICRHAQLLIALWDGTDNEKKGGTAYVVHKFRTGHRSDAAGENEKSDLLDFPDCGPVWHIPTRRRSGETSTPFDGSGSYLYPAPNESKTVDSPAPDEINPATKQDHFERDRWNEIFKSFDTFNYKAKSLEATAPQTIITNREYLTNGIPSEDQSTAVHLCSDLYAIADTLSQNEQKLRHKYFLWIIYLFLLTVFAEAIYSGPYPQWWVLVIATLCGGLAFALYRRTEKLRLEEGYFDYRSLAEGLRVQYYWSVAGSPRCVADDFLRDQRDSLEWIRQALLFPELERQINGAGNPPFSAAKFKAVMNIWIKGQKEYFLGSKNGEKVKKGKSSFHEKAGKRMEDRSKYSLMVGLALLAATILWHKVYVTEDNPDANLLLQSLIVLYSLCFWLLPTSELYRRVMAHEETARNYQSAGLTFQACEMMLKKAIDGGNKVQSIYLLEQIGQRALAENNRWLLTHRDRPLQPPM